MPEVADRLSRSVQARDLLARVARRAGGLVQAVGELGVGSLRVLGRLELCNLVADALGRLRERVEASPELGKSFRLQAFRHAGLHAGRLLFDLREFRAVGAL